ncbi:hypothetical protein IF1G_00261 [Cordyceps javanica]|uniref:Secreted protein n=1 Tax=Cordyceps javanica TaxID=43265 RepID=A0A545VFD8_9HYPO|nr:hypothetical protein IF1G_00261 [Cordyceps javanica]
MTQSTRKGVGGTLGSLLLLVVRVAHLPASSPTHVFEMRRQESWPAQTARTHEAVVSAIGSDKVRTRQRQLSSPHLHRASAFLAADEQRSAALLTPSILRIVYILSAFFRRWRHNSGHTVWQPAGQISQQRGRCERNLTLHRKTALLLTTQNNLVHSSEPWHCRPPGRPPGRAALPNPAMLSNALPTGTRNL